MREFERCENQAGGRVQHPARNIREDSSKGVSMKRDVLVTSLVRQKPILKSVQKPAAGRGKDALGRLEHLESQMAKLSELVREHAEDVDRLVRIVAEDRDVIRRQLLRKHHEQVRVRKHLRDSGSKAGLDF
jgi:hypothetical protein